MNEICFGAINRVAGTVDEAGINTDIIKLNVFTNLHVADMCGNSYKLINKKRSRRSFLIRLIITVIFRSG